MGKVSEVVKEVKYALKEMNVRDASVSQQRRFIGEYEKLSMLEHPNIVRAFGMCLSDAEHPPSILLELCACDLASLLRSGKQEEASIAFMAYEIAEAMRYVHKRGLIHRDLKPSNILIGSDGGIRVSDFGIATLQSTDDQSTTSVGGTQKFMAPELLREEKYDEKVDVYSFGVLLFFIVSGGEMPRISIIDIGTGKKARIPSSFTDVSRRIIDACWNFDPKKRPSFESILKELDKNDYKVVDLSESEVHEVRNSVSEHKKKLPKY